MKTKRKLTIVQAHARLKALAKGASCRSERSMWSFSHRPNEKPDREVGVYIEDIGVGTIHANTWEDALAEMELVLKKRGGE